MTSMHPTEDDKPHASSKLSPAIVVIVALTLLVGLGGGYWFSQSQKTTPISEPVVIHSKPTPTPTPEPEAFKPSQTADHELVIPQSEWDQLMTLDMKRLLSDAKLSSVRVNNVLTGVRLTRIKPGSMYAKVGLEDNDVVEQFNGVAVADMKADGVSHLRVPGARAIDIVVKRKTKLVTLRLRIGEAAAGSR